MSAVRIVIVLTMVAVLSGGSLAVVFGFADPLIQANRRRETREAVMAVVPGTARIERGRRVKGEIVFRVLDKNGRLLGYAFPTEFSGFQGKIKIMVGMDSKLETITGLVVLENVETPGLGNKISDKSWRDGFRGLSGEEEIRLVKNQAADREQNEVEAITGATISSQAVVKGATARIMEVRKAVTGR